VDVSILGMAGTRLGDGGIMVSAGDTVGAIGIIVGALA
jgi:hypothetical protein